MNEFDLIRKYFIPLAEHFPGSLNLSDDAAIISVPPGHDLVITKDAISENIHYLPGTDPALIAQKLLRTNLSDLAAMGAEPLCYFLAIALPKPLSEDFIRRFTEGLRHDQSHFNIHLAGGDTIATSGTPTFSLTAHGIVPHGQALRRSCAKTGDDLYMSGTLGDGALGLLAAQAGIANHLSARYHLPEPRLTLGIALRGLATSCMDISDGLLQDAAHIAATSKVGVEIHQETLPLSAETRASLTQSPELITLVLNGGDDYELLFTLPENAAPPSGHAVTKIGKIITGSGITLLHHGKAQPIIRAGHSH